MANESEFKITRVFPDPNDLQAQKENEEIAAFLIAFYKRKVAQKKPA